MPRPNRSTPGSDPTPGPRSSPRPEAHPGRRPARAERGERERRCPATSRLPRPGSVRSAGCQSSPSRVGCVDTLSIAIVPAVASVSDGRLTTTSRPSTSTGSAERRRRPLRLRPPRSEVGVERARRSCGPVASGDRIATKRWTRPRASRTVTIGASVDPSSSDRSTGSRVGSPVSGSVTTSTARRSGRSSPARSAASRRGARAATGPAAPPAARQRAEVGRGLVATKRDEAWRGGGSSASSSPSAAVVARTLCRSTGIAPSTPSIAAKAVSSAARREPARPADGHDPQVRADLEVGLVGLRLRPRGGVRHGEHAHRHREHQEQRRARVAQRPAGELARARASRPGRDRATSPVRRPARAAE